MPKKLPGGEGEAYRRHRDRVDRAAAAAVRAARELPEIPPPKDPERRRRALESTEAFGKTYFASRVPLELSEDHRTYLRECEQAEREGGHKAIGMPRGSGKTTWAELHMLRAILSGSCKFGILIGSTGDAAKRMADSIKGALESDLLAEDFPEVCLPIREIDGKPQRCRGQTYRGKHTYIRWERSRIVFPKIPGSACSESVLVAVPLLGSFRGMKHVTSEGVGLRPTTAIVDDPQTPESAASRQQTMTRLNVILRDVVKLAGPSDRMCVIVPCTVIAKGDLSDQLLDRDLFPAFRGQRCKRVPSMPRRLDLWQEYGRVWADGMKSVGSWQAATQYYRAHQEEMDAGAVVSWPARKPRGYDSEIEAAMSAFLHDKGTFLAEDQGEPEDEQASDTDLLVSQVLDRFSGRHRGVVPSWGTKITAHVDVSHSVLWWMVCAWDSSTFTGSIIDYGSWPNQKGRRYYTLADAQYTIQDALPGESLAAQLHKAISDCETWLCGRDFAREDGTMLRLSRLLIDCGDEMDTIFEQHARSAHRAISMPSRGHGIGPGDTPMAEYKQRPGETLYPGVVVYTPPKRTFRVARMDTNRWKSHVTQAIRQASGSPGSISLFGTSRSDADHQMLADHLTAERGYLAEAKGRRVVVWEQVKKGQDNHWLDTLYGCAAAACIEGVRTGSMASAPTRAKKSAADAQRRAWERQGINR